MRFSDIKQNSWDYDKKTILNALKRYFTVDMPTDSSFPITKDTYTIYLSNETTESIPVTLKTHLNTRDTFDQLTGHIDTKTLETLYNNHFEDKPSFTDDFLQQLICKTVDQGSFLTAINKALGIDYLENLTNDSSTVLETYFGPYFEDLLKETNLPYELDFKYTIRNIHTIDIYNGKTHNYLRQHPETNQWSLDELFSKEDELTFKKDYQTILSKLVEQPKALIRTLTLQNPLSEVLKSQIDALRTLPTTLYATNEGRRWIYDNGSLDYDNDYDDYNDRNRYDINIPVNLNLTADNTLNVIFPIQKGQSLIPAQKLIDSDNQYLFRKIKKQLKSVLINNTLKQVIEPRKHAITSFLDRLPKHGSLKFKENGNTYELTKWATESISYEYNNHYLIEFRKENNGYTYKATSSLYDIDEALLKDLITDLINKF